MDFDTNALNRLLSQSDERLWQMICKIGALNGISISEAMPPKEEMTKLRALLSNAENADYAQAIATIEQYKRKG